MGNVSFIMTFFNRKFPSHNTLSKIRVLHKQKIASQKSQEMLKIKTDTIKRLKKNLKELNKLQDTTKLENSLMLAENKNKRMKKRRTAFKKNLSASFDTGKDKLMEKLGVKDSEIKQLQNSNL